VNTRAAQFHALYRNLRIVDQLKYYGDRRREYQKAHREVSLVRNVLLTLAATSGALGQTLDNTGRALTGGLAAALAALAGAITAFEALMGFPELNKLYADFELNLGEAEVDWDSADPEGDLSAEVDRVEAVFDRENGQWGQLVVENAAKRPPGFGPPAIDGSA
jgi:hypothetical protein